VPESERQSERGILDDIAELAIPFGITDFAEQLHHYLHGHPKQ
jgi:hypothetical protein